MLTSCSSLKHFSLTRITLKKPNKPKNIKFPGLWSARVPGLTAKMNGFPFPGKPKLFTVPLGEKSEDINRLKSHNWIYLISQRIGIQFALDISFVFHNDEKCFISHETVWLFNPSRTGWALPLSETDKLSLLYLSLLVKILKTAFLPIVMVSEDTVTFCKGCLPWYPWACLSLFSSEFFNGQVCQTAERLCPINAF